MLDARAELHKQQQPNGYVTANPWDDIGTSFPPTPTTPCRTNRAGTGNGSAPESSSPSPSPSVKSVLRSRRPGSHRRISTVDGSLPSHPLQSPSMRSAITMDGAITRPALKRRLGSECELYDDSEQGSSEGDLWADAQQSVSDAEVIVIVHELTRTDSIAGVALKYGISLSDLRRANHLWASDSIHLRKVLYIPLHLSSRRDLYYSSNGHCEVKPTNGEAPAESSTAATARSGSSVIIQRIPLSQLAFFPPSSQPSPSLSPDSERKRSAFPGAPMDLSPSLLRMQSESSGAGTGTATLSALLNALPLPLPKARDRFFPRLSIDSSETSTNASETSSDQEQEHEMDLLGESRAQTRKRTLSGSRGRSAKEHRKRHSTASIETLRKAGMYNAEEDTPLVPLQTEQLKPSPQMQLPRALMRNDG